MLIFLNRNSVFNFKNMQHGESCCEVLVEVKRESFSKITLFHAMLYSLQYLMHFVLLYKVMDPVSGSSSEFKHIIQLSSSSTVYIFV